MWYYLKRSDCPKNLINRARNNDWNYYVWTHSWLHKVYSRLCKCFGLIHCGGRSLLWKIKSVQSSFWMHIICSLICKKLSTHNLNTNFVRVLASRGNIHRICKVKLDLQFRCGELNKFPFELQHMWIWELSWDDCNL